MVGLSENEVDGLRVALEAERRSLVQATAAVAQFGSMPVFVDLGESANRHMETLMDLLRQNGSDIPVPKPVPMDRFPSVADALEAALSRQTEIAEHYDRLLEQCSRPDLRRVLFNLWQSSSRRHRAAIDHHLSDDQQDTG